MILHKVIYACMFLYDIIGCYSTQGYERQYSYNLLMKYSKFVSNKTLQQITTKYNIVSKVFKESVYLDEDSFKFMLCDNIYWLQSLLDEGGYKKIGDDFIERINNFNPENVDIDKCFELLDKFKEKINEKN